MVDARYYHWVALTIGTLFLLVCFYQWPASASWFASPSDPLNFSGFAFHVGTLASLGCDMGMADIGRLKHLAR